MFQIILSGFVADVELPELIESAVVFPDLGMRRFDVELHVPIEPEFSILACFRSSLQVNQLIGVLRTCEKELPRLLDSSRSARARYTPACGARKRFFSFVTQP